jgi:DNA polymerase-3 subunit delta
MASTGRLSPSEVRRQIASGTLAPVYLVTGQDEREKTGLAAVFAEAVEEDFRVFNVERFYGAETTIAAVVDAARTLPLMASRRVIVVLQAEKLIEPKREGKAADAEAKMLAEYVRAPQPHAVVVFVAGGLDGRRRSAKLLFERAVVVECGGLADRDEAAAWVRQAAGGRGVKISADAIALLLDRARADLSRLKGGERARYRSRDGRPAVDMSRLSTDIERVLLFAADKKTVSRADVEATTDAENVQQWAIVDAIQHRTVGPALRELALVLDTGTLPVQVLGQLAWMVRTEGQFPPSRLGAAVEAVFRTDLALKSSAGDPRVLLERLVVELCGGEAAGSPHVKHDE